MPTNKKQIKGYVSYREYAIAETKAKEKGLTVANWVRVRCGFKPIYQGAPKRNQNAKKESE